MGLVDKNCGLSRVMLGRRPPAFTSTRSFIAPGAIVFWVYVCVVFRNSAGVPDGFCGWLQFRGELVLLDDVGQVELLDADAE